jgi:hypothetical protein
MVKKGPAQAEKGEPGRFAEHSTQIIPFFADAK